MPSNEPPDNQGDIHEVADVKILKDYISKLVPLLLEDGGYSPNSFHAKLDEGSSVDLLKKFLSDPQSRTFMIERVANKGLFRF